MTLEIWLAFVLAAGVLLWIPGPTILLIVSYALSRGRGVALSTALGAVLGDLVAMTLSFLGVGALLAASAELFVVLKWIGALYLIWLGVKMWRSRPDPAGPAEAQGPGRGLGIFGHAFAVTLLNPKSIMFFIAFMPQFIDPAAPVVPQMVLLGATFLGLAFLSCASYGLLAGGFRDSLASPRRQIVINRLGGGVLIGAGVFAAAMKRNA